MKINISISFNGNCEEAINFYANVFNTQVIAINRYKEMPQCNDFVIKEEDKNKITHAVIMLTPDFSLIANDDIFDKKNVGNNISISVNFTTSDNIDKAKAIYDKLVEHGKEIMPWSKTFWNANYGKIIDKFGVTWEINYQL